MRTGPHDYGPREWGVFFYSIYARQTKVVIVRRKTLTAAPATARDLETDGDSAAL